MADKDTYVSAVLQTSLCAEPIKIVLNQDQEGGYSKRCTLRFADDIDFDTCKRHEDDLYEAETTVGSIASRAASPSVMSSWRESPRPSVTPSLVSSWREYSRPSVSPSLLSSRPSYHSVNHLMDDDGSSDDEIIDEVHQSRSSSKEVHQSRSSSKEVHQSRSSSKEVHQSRSSSKEVQQSRSSSKELQQSRSSLRGITPSKHTEGASAHYAPQAPCMANPSALELEIAAAELKVAALRAEMAAKRARAGNKRPDGNRTVQQGSSIPLPAAVQASACNPSKYSMLSTSPCPTAPASSSRQSNTTVMLRNVPNDYTRDMVVELLESLGFGSCFDFVYAPFDFKRCSALGYAFVNFTTNEHAARAMVSLSGFCSWKVQSRKIMQVSWTDSWQGLSANIERYRNSPVMHPDVPERFKPSLYQDGRSIPFPLPTKALSKPSFA